MKKYLGTILVLVIAIAMQILPVFAWDDCPFGMVNDPYPGSCPRYIDTNNDGICDHSQSAPTATSASPESPSVSEGGTQPPLTQANNDSQEVSDYAQHLEELSLLPFKELKALTVQELEEKHGLPSGPLLSTLASKGISADLKTPLSSIIKVEGLSREEFLAFLGQVYQGQKTTGNIATTDTQNTQTSSTPTLLVAGESRKGKSDATWWTRSEAFTLFSILFLILLLKGLTLYEKRFPKKSLSWFTLKNYHFALNLILLVSFALSFISGLMDYLSLTFDLFSTWGKTIVALHYDSSFVMLLVGAVHAFWHIPYYGGCLRQTRKLWKKNRKTFWKWALNVVLTASFIVSILSGLLNYLALWFHWRGVATPSLEVHIYSSLVMMGVAVLHTLWHLEYYRKNLSFSPGARPKLISESKGCPIS